MNSIRFLSLMLATIMIFCFASCKSTDKDTSGTGSRIDNGDYIQYDINPNKPEKVASAAADHKPESGYEYKKEENIILPNDDAQADGFLLTTTDKETNETKDIVSVYHEQGEYNILELDVMVENATDADIDAAVKLVRELMVSYFENFPINEIEKHLPLSTQKIKALIYNNEQVSETIYGANTETSISYDYYPKGCILIFRIES